jgi:hypothetical protein
MKSTTQRTRGLVLALLISPASMAFMASAIGAMGYAGCATISGLDSLAETDGLGDASVDQGSAGYDASFSPDAGQAMGQDAGAGTDGGGEIMDAGKDTGPTTPIPSIVCGNDQCALAGQFCCYSRQNPKSSTCELADAASSCAPLLGKDPLYCDDKADCPQAKPFCCFDKNGSAACDTEANCSANAGRFLCSTLADCPDSSTNCSAGAGVFNLIVCK